MKYEIKLIDGSVLIGDFVVINGARLAIVQMCTDNNTMCIVDQKDIIYSKAFELTDEELDEELEYFTSHISVPNKFDDEIDDGDVDPEESPNDYYTFQTPINPTMYG